MKVEEPSLGINTPDSEVGIHRLCASPENTRDQSVTATRPFRVVNAQSHIHLVVSLRDVIRFGQVNRD